MSELVYLHSDRGHSKRQILVHVHNYQHDRQHVVHHMSASYPINRDDE